ncbi:surface lipoprotein assembly modifier [Campylobacter mucosalis]|uniref:surface lipoprotein assembly modifier n=1 Tax=Campylobacter mucosalis TaxID=202 RepID=UPI001B8C9DA1
MLFKLDYKINEKIISKSKIRVSKKNFIKSDYKYKNALNYTLETALGYDSNTFGVTTLGLFLGSENRLKGKPHPNVDYNLFGIKLQNLYQLTPKTSLITSAEYHNERYKATENFLYGTKRKNDKITYEAGLMQNLGGNFTLGINFRYTDTNSNQSIYDYQKYTIKANLYYSF